MILQVDMGNTRIKWRLLDAGVRVDGGSCLSGSEFKSLENSLFPYRGRIARVLVASVLSSESDVEFTQWLEQKLNVLPEFASSESFRGLLINGYSVPEQLGVDRWLGMLAAYQMIGDSCVVVSLGTAVTLDLITAQGAHCGGYIAPGIRLFTQVLVQSTARIKSGAGIRVCDLTPGLTTEQAVHRAYVAMIRGLVDNALQQLQLRDAGGQPKLVITGGDGRLLSEMYTGVYYCEELVMDGLTLFFQLN